MALSLLTGVLLLCSSVSSFQPLSGSRSLTRPAITQLAATHSLKPAAAPLMDAGKALARSGELLIDVTTALDLYGGALSATGAEVRNAGDAVAQAAASMRFKTALELVTDELREGGTCLQEASQKCQRAVQEAKQDELTDLVSILGACFVIRFRQDELYSM